MKQLAIIFLTLFFQCISAQSIFEYEQRISKSEDLEFLEISFTNSGDDVQLSGTLICPKEGYDKIVMIIPGSGKDTRHSHFLLAEKFLENEIAVYRFDERGIGNSKGKYDYTASSLMKDVVSAYDKLRSEAKLADKKIGVLGHSLGGIASIGAHGRGCDFDFMIQMATPIENNGAFITYQALINTDGFYSVKDKSTNEVISFLEALQKIVLAEDDFKASKKKAKALMKKMDFKKGAHIVNPLIIDLMKQNHEITYQTSTIPILYIIGTEDRIVSGNNEIIALERLNNPNIKIKLIQNVNHWLSDKIAPTKMDRSLYHMNESAKHEIIKWTLEN